MAAWEPPPPPPEQPPPSSAVATTRAAAATISTARPRRSRAPWSGACSCDHLREAVDCRGAADLRSTSAPPSAGTRSAERRGRALRQAAASSTGVIASAVAYASTSAPSRPTTVTASGPESAGMPVAGSIRWWSCRSGPNRRWSRPDVATAPSSIATVARSMPGRRGIRDGEPPRAALGRRAPDGDVAAEVDEPARELDPRFAHRQQGARGREPFAEPAEIDSRPCLDRARRDCRCRSRRSRQGASMAAAAGGRPSSCSNERSYPAAASAGSIVGSNFPPRLLTRAERDSECYDQPLVDGRPLSRTRG